MESTAAASSVSVESAMMPPSRVAPLPRFSKTSSGKPQQNLYRNRFYRPDLGRFLSKDPVEGGNPYAYVGNSPLSLTDPSGKKVCRCDRRIANPVFWFSLTLDPYWHHSFVRIVPPGLPCDGPEGAGWGFQDTNRVQPEVTPSFNPHLKCHEVPCIDEDVLYANIQADMIKPPYDYVKFCRVGPGWNARNCQGWADDVLNRSKKQPCCEGGSGGSGDGASW
jgi:RHS repeat-associated protein